MWKLRQLERVGDERALTPVDGRGERVALKGCEQFVIFGERTESLAVMAYSIVTVIDH